VDVFNPESGTRKNTDIYINPASQELYADFYNGMLGTNMTWQEIFAQTDRDINLQRVMNAMVFGAETRGHDDLPDRAVGPTDDSLYEAEAEFNDGEAARLLGRPPEEIRALPTSRKREILMDARRRQLRELILIYYRERGWTSGGIPTVDTLNDLGLWEFLNEETRKKISELAV
jgi:aldehyde:ferredoxin oxidoreductase